MATATEKVEGRRPEPEEWKEIFSAGWGEMGQSWNVRSKNWQLLLKEALLDLWHHDNVLLMGSMKAKDINMYLSRRFGSKYKVVPLGLRNAHLEKYYSMRVFG